MSDDDNSIRSLSDNAARGLDPGSKHYTAFVGPPDQYDLMGATQFMLLTTLGLRDHHRLLDFGCGSLRVGRFLIAYLRRGNYHGLEPSEWLIEDAIDRQLGRDIIGLKWPHFHFFEDFRADRCGIDFDFILAQSMFSHAGSDIVTLTLGGFFRALAESGIALVTFIHPGQGGVPEFDGSGWVYPGCVAHAPATISMMIEKSGLFGRPLPWFHPRQAWYALARNPDRLPREDLDHHLRGAILNVEAWRESL